ncbi:MAG: hypothetical protein ABFD90_09820 [Phycisphaerales bacterium]
MVDCPARDSARSVLLWFVLFALLLLRKVNRTRRAWVVLLPLFAIYGILHIAENMHSSFGVWYISIYFRSFLCDALRALGLAIALLAMVSDLVEARSRRFRLVFACVVVLLAGGAAIGVNAPAASSTEAWIVGFGAMTLLSAFGLGIIAILLRWLTGRSDPRVLAGVCLVLGAGPVCILEGINLLCGSIRPSITMDITMVGGRIFSQVVFAPYLIFFCFLLLAVLSPLYRRRLTGCFTGEIPTSRDA